jgi:glycosyltransferase involved in cell wall biosynthesis
LSGTKIILDIHDILPEFYSTRYGKTRGSFFVKILIFLERVSNKFSDYVIIANPIWHERLISRGLNPDKLITIPNYPNPEVFFLRSKKSSNGKFVATYPGTLNWHQGVDIAVQAYARVVQEFPEAEFHIYGGGPEKDKLVQLVGELKVEKNVLFRDFLPIEEIVTVMANSDLAIVPKRSKSTFGTEAASTKILEFMSVGVPIVVSRTKIDSHYHTDSTVKFYDSDDPNQLADAIMEMMRDPSLRNRLSANALAYAQEQSWDRKKIEYLAIVDSLVSHK